MYGYRIKIINPSDKNNFIVHDLHWFHGKFDSVTSMKVKIIEEFKEVYFLSVECSELDRK